MRNRIATRMGSGPRVPFPRRAAGLAAGFTLGAALLAGCGSEGAVVNCRTDASCLITFDRTIDANASVLGVQAKLVGVDGSQVTVEIAGEQVSLWMDEPATEVAGLAVNLERVNDKEVVVKVAQA